MRPKMRGSILKLVVREKDVSRQRSRVSLSGRLINLSSLSQRQLRADIDLIVDAQRCKILAFKEEEEAIHSAAS